MVRNMVKLFFMQQRIKRKVGENIMQTKIIEEMDLEKELAEPLENYAMGDGIKKVKFR
jgi:hypothetical protein